jgi:hypothetical protein
MYSQRMEESTRRDTQEQVGVKLMKSDGPSEDESPEVQYTRKKQYEIALGKLHYIAHSARYLSCGESAESISTESR